MIKIRIERPDAPLAGTFVMTAVREILAEANIQNPGLIEARADDTGKSEFIISVTSDKVADVLRKELPKKEGYRIIG